MGFEGGACGGVTSRVRVCELCRIHASTIRPSFASSCLAAAEKYCTAGGEERIAVAGFAGRC